jgi:glycerol-3-phosphate dehydrogenase (NAD(P)+)
MEKIAVIGGGAWGTALASLAAESGRPVELYAREKGVIDSINDSNENSLFLKDMKLNPTVTARYMDDLSSCDAQYIIWTVPTQFSRSVARQYSALLKGRYILNASKGIEIDTGKLVVQTLAEEIDAKFAILSGPSFAKEVALKKLTAVSLSSNDPEVAKWWQRELSCDYFRVYTASDMVGLEVGGAVKNVIAIATGLSDGIGMDDNARAGIITRGLAEIARLGISYGAQRETFYGLAGLGDLVLTTTGDKSRNRQVGKLLAEGLTVEDIQKKYNSVAEGVFTAKAVYLEAQRHNISMPICTEVYRIIYEGKNPIESANDLMRRPLRPEEDETI